MPNHSPPGWVLLSIGGLFFLYFAFDAWKILKAGGYWGARSMSYISRDETPGQFWLQIGLRIVWAVLPLILIGLVVHFRL